jgi:hypothetical protein
MEQAPPGAPELYLTPQLKKRRDGLCPSLFLSSAPAKPVPGGVSKVYRTNSNLLLQVPEREGVSAEVSELQTLVESVTKGLKAVIGPTKEVAVMDFTPQGSRWNLAFGGGGKLADAADNYRIEVICKANEVEGVTNFVLDTLLLPQGEADPNPLAPPMKGYREAKQAFDNIAIAVRKGVVRLEFPEFPEGCKGKAFREVYQLNARVSRPDFFVPPVKHLIWWINCSRIYTHACRFSAFFFTAKVWVLCHGLSRNPPFHGP